MSERSRAAAAGKAGEHFADMALGDGFGALVSFDSTSSVPHLGEDAVAAASEEITLGAVEDADANTNAHPPSDPTTFAAAAAAETTELPNPLEGRNSMAQVVPEPDFLLDADGFGAILCAEMAMEQKDVPATMPPPAPSGALYPEVANWLANACANDGTAGKTALNASSDKGITGKSRPSLIQRIDRYLFPPSKLIVDGTLLPSPASPPKLNGNGSKLEVDFPPDGRKSSPDSSNKKRDRSLIGTARLGSIVGAVSRRSSHVATANNKTPIPIPPPPPNITKQSDSSLGCNYSGVSLSADTSRLGNGKRDAWCRWFACGGIRVQNCSV